MAKLMRISAGHGLSVAALVLVLAVAPAYAQSKGKAARSGAAAPAAGDAGLQARVQSLEEQLVDMQVIVGTLETLAKNGGSAPAPFPASSSGGDGDAARIEGLETQVRALTTEVQQLSDQVRSLGGTPRRSEIAPSSDTALNGQGAYPQAQPSAGTATPGFGSTTVSSGNDAIGGFLNSDGAQQGQASTTLPAPGAPAAAPVATAALAPASETSNDPKQLYETAYGYLLQRDYGAAETSFDEFLKKFPNDSLSGNAQYWLGETHFVRGEYKAAASAFLKGYQTYKQSPKAPDSLLKLAMSLDRLGQKDAACASFGELLSKFPTAPQSVKARAQTERQRVGCQ
ncbi:tol-pal system protein YbgF [Hyphomicrobium sp.]|uniref:tol-pal system protein YbgF n=1 Tax=Hyphomicrobium sp. TaxID=82 RepID=UPI002C44CAA1|nr:tol-pal system protein YbgF [Hyphomicrobium sp.]HVZ04668.1 tol-pal system protein YbgF [Hyphomicrobium sp.]